MHQTSGRSRFHLSPSQAHRMLRACPSQFHTERETALASHMSIFKAFSHTLIYTTLISHCPSKSHGRDQSLRDEDVVLLTLQRNAQRPHGRMKELETIIQVYCTHMAPNWSVTRTITSLCRCTGFPCYLQYRGCRLRLSGGLTVSGLTCTLVNFSFRRSSEAQSGAESW